MWWTIKSIATANNKLCKRTVSNQQKSFKKKTQIAESRKKYNNLNKQISFYTTVCAFLYAGFLYIYVQFWDIGLHEGAKREFTRRYGRNKVFSARHEAFIHIRMSERAEHGRQTQSSIELNNNPIVSDNAKPKKK